MKCPMCEGTGVPYPNSDRGGKIEPCPNCGPDGYAERWAREAIYGMLPKVVSRTKAMEDAVFGFANAARARLEREP